VVYATIVAASNKALNEVEEQEKACKIYFEEILPQY
jgi:hypothetical protein